MTSTADIISITQRQREVLAFIAKHWLDNGYGPAIRDISLAFNFASPNGAVCHLIPLKRRGLVTWEENRCRTLRLTPVAKEVDLGL